MNKKLIDQHTPFHFFTGGALSGSSPNKLPVLLPPGGIPPGPALGGLYGAPPIPGLPIGLTGPPGPPGPPYIPPPICPCPGGLC